jgi:hypothetical protein
MSRRISAVFVRFEERRERLGFGNRASDPGRGTGADDETARRILKAMAKKISWLEAGLQMGKAATARSGPGGAA